MIKHFVVTAIRSLLRNRVYTVAKVLSLSLGLIGCLVVYQVVHFERSFDIYHNDPDRIFRFVRESSEFGETKYSSSSPYRLPQTVRAEFPEFEAITIVDALVRSRIFAVTQDDGTLERFKEESGVAFVEPAYFKIFNYTWLAGSPEHALTNSGNVVISETLARKYFGAADPIGRVILHDNTIPLTVTGLVKDVPPNTNLPFNMLIAFNPRERIDPNWNNLYGPVQCFGKLVRGVNSAEVESKLPSFLRRHLKPEDAAKLTIHLQPLNEIHFDSRFGTFSRTMPEGLLWALITIGAALLLVACINAINLLTAQADDRTKEIGVRRVLGSSRLLLGVQTLIETILLVFVSVGFSLAVINLIIGNIDLILGYQVSSLTLANPSTALFFLLLVFSVTLMAGIIPALKTSGYSGRWLDKGGKAAPRSRYTLRRGLVVLQFLISQVLMIAGIVIYEQSSYLLKADMGFSRKAVVEVPLPDADDAVLERFKSQMLQHPEILSVSFNNTGTASFDDWGGDYTLTDGSQILEEHADIKFIDNDYLKTYDVNLVAGENINTSNGTLRVLVNETFAKTSGYGSHPEDLLGKTVSIWTRVAPIVGIVRDFHTRSFRTAIQPVVLVPENIYRQAGIKVSAAEIGPAITAIQKEWMAAYPQNIFEYHFLDETVNAFYQNEQRTNRFVEILTATTIVIGCLGLFGLISFLAVRRRKEIGIRKVLGATTPGVVGLLSKELLILVGIASLAGWPIAFQIMTSWLQDYAYRIDLEWWMFISAGALSLLLALATIAWQAIRAAMANPVDALRYE